ncbi:DUF5806 family protein [Halobaculum sp. D14]|uniref:DUF5806 family protein n=1 Tax=Halobaculum sp. D14 TaxID=3421642 RepID=UPI003EBD4737
MTDNAGQERDRVDPAGNDVDDADAASGDPADATGTDAADTDATETDAADATGADATDAAAEARDDADADADATAAAGTDAGDAGGGSVPGPDVGADVPEDVAKYDRFQKMERAEYDRVNEFLRERTYVTAREWAIARLCADFRTETGVEMTKIGENLPRLVPFMTDTYTPQAVNQARASFEEKVRKAGATFLYGAMCGFFTAEDLDDTMYEVTEVAKFLLEVEGVDLAVEEELEAEDKISSVMRDVREASAEVRGEEVKCPECGHVHEPE